MKTWVFAAVFFAPAAVAPAIADEKAPAPKGDLAKLQGAWTGQIGPDKEIGVRLVFKGADVTLVMSRPGEKPFETTGEITIDDQAKPFKTIDWRKFAKPDGGDLGENKSIYEFEDADTLKVCSGGPDNDRPTEFKAGEDGHTHLLVLKRDKAKDNEKEKAASTEAPRGDLAKFQGKWTTKVGPNKDFVLSLVIKGNVVTLSGTTGEGEDFALKGEMKLDEAAKKKSLDWVNFKGPQGRDLPDNLALYEIKDADTIEVCSGGPGNERPTEFKEGEGGPPHIVILKRMKD
ncbi:TIGR03067 domain-containing protein [Singulisphaera rosea]